MQYKPTAEKIDGLLAIIQSVEDATGITPSVAELATLNRCSETAINTIIRAVGGITQRTIVGGDEGWRVIPSYQAYEVSESGLVRRRVATHRYRAGSVVRQHIDAEGYPYVHLCLWPEDSKHYRVNRLVCEAFCGLPLNADYQAAHQNGVRSDCRAENIRWKTSKENNADKILHGTDPVGARNPRAKLSDQDVQEIRRLLANKSNTVTSIAKLYCVGPTAISRIKLGKSWKHLPCLDER